MTIDEKYMQRCLQLARMGRGTTYGNPMVGAVIVFEDTIIGEGYHHHAGGPHAEVNAVNSVKEQDRHLLEKSTIYVSLEPCAHFGKTPPCADLIVANRFKRVVVGCVDSFGKVSGRGIEKIKAAGIDVTVGVLERECVELNARFFTFHNDKRPYVILKWAESADGFISPMPVPQEPLWLTNDHCKTMVHKQRTEEMAILIGATTAKNDNPSLTPRMWHGCSPRRFILSPKASIDAGALKMFADEGVKPTVISDGMLGEADSLQKAVLDYLYTQEIQSVIVEGGRQTLQGFIDAGLWDEAYVYRSLTQNVGNGVGAPVICGVPERQVDAGGVVLDIYRRKTRNNS